MRTFIRQNLYWIFPVLIATSIVVAFIVPLKTQEEVLDTKDITGNYIFAADIEYKGQRIGASSELCCFILFNKNEFSQIHVIVKKGLIFDRRYVDLAKHPKTSQKNRRI